MLKRQDTIERDVVVFEFTKNSKPPAKPEPTVIEEVKISHTETLNSHVTSWHSSVKCL